MAIKPYSPNLTISSHQGAIDRKDKQFFDKLSDEEKKKLALYVVMKYAANVDGDPDLQHYYLYAVNEHVNKNFFDINKHPKLQWLLLSTVSPNIGKQNHYWIPTKKNESSSNVIKFLRKIYPNRKRDELELLASIMTNKELLELADEYCIDHKELK